MRRGGQQYFLKNIYYVSGIMLKHFSSLAPSLLSGDDISTLQGWHIWFTDIRSNRSQQMSGT